MMRRRSVLGMGPAAVALAAAGLAGCTQPIYNVESQAFGNPGTLEARAMQIERAGAGLGWQVARVRPGVMRATLNLRTHVAITEITYDTERFAIRYVDSANLQYDGTSIHRNYNGWIHNLERAIRLQPSA